MIRRFFSMCAVGFVMSGCAGHIYVKSIDPTFINKNNYYVQSKVASYKVLYGTRFSEGFEGEKIGQREIDAYGETAEHIRTYLEKHGYIVSLGDAEDIPTSAEIIVSYDDYWQWDFTKYLKYLKIEFIDNKTKNKMVVGEYVAEQGEFHDYPSSQREVPNVLDSIFHQAIIKEPIDNSETNR